MKKKKKWIITEVIDEWNEFDLNINGFMFVVNQEIQHSNTTTNLNDIFCKDSNENSFFGYLHVGTS